MKRHLGLILAATAATCTALGFVACGGDDSKSNGADAAADHSANDATTGDTGSDTGAQDSAQESMAADSGADADGGGGCDLFDASSLDEAAVQAGFLAVWNVRHCYACHQNPTQQPAADGSGILLSGNDSGNLGPNLFPPNLTNSPEGLGCWTNDQIQTAVLTGHDPEGGTLCPPMPVWGASPNFMDAGEAQNIIAFIRSLTPSANVLPDTTCNTDGGSDASSDATGQ